jgi:hypothetical protein
MLCQRVLRGGRGCHPVFRHQLMRRGSEDTSTDTDAPAQRVYS